MLVAVIVLLVSVAQELWGFLQMVASFSVTMPAVAWPAASKDFSDAIGNIVQFDIALHWGRLECDVRSNFCWNVGLLMHAFLVAFLTLPLWLALARRCRSVRPVLAHDF